MKKIKNFSFLINTAYKIFKAEGYKKSGRVAAQKLGEEVNNE